MAAKSNNTAPPRPTIVVGIGASAGGLNALNQFFDAMPANSGLAFVVVQHLDPSHDSALTELLSRRTTMQVCEATDGMTVSGNTVYVIPPNRNLALQGDKLTLSGPTKHDRIRLPIDYFLTSLADARHETAVGIILSGSGRDGTLGIREVKNVGGLTIAQNPGEAEQDGMPRSAIESGHVDKILPVGKMPEVLCQYARHSYMHGTLTAQRLQSDDRATYTALLQTLREATGYDFRRYRKNTMSRRIQRRMGLRQTERLSEYLHHLRDSREECQALVKDLLIGVTSFFRDKPAWSLLDEKVVPDLCELASAENRNVRIWSAGCASGEEAYSLAMSFFDYVSHMRTPCKFQIFATDISEDAMDLAREGNYSESIVHDIGKDKLGQYFTRTESGYQVKKSLRESVVFAQQNLLSQPPFSKLDLIVCRNLLIYLEPEAQKRLMSVFQFSLNLGGFLFLGNSEHLGDQTNQFRVISKPWRLFQRNMIPYSVPPAIDSQADIMEAPQTTGGSTSRLTERIHRQLMSENRSALVAITENNAITYLEGQVDEFLMLAPGEQSPRLMDILEVAREGLRAKLRLIIQQVRQDKEAVRSRVRMKKNGKYVQCELHVRPLWRSDQEADVILVGFAPVDTQARTQTVPSRQPAEEASDDHAQTIQELRLELQTTRAQLNSTIEELETANEELRASNEEAMATNEELQSTNEELETSKEELQSLNEELSTLNTQLEFKINQLERITNDLNNLITSTQIGTLFLDSQFHIRSFTPACRELFNLIEADRGRSLQDITPKFAGDESLLDEAEMVLDDLQPREKQVMNREGRAFVRRILPYRTDENRIEGVVITFNDVSRLHDISARLQLREMQQATLATLGIEVLNLEDPSRLLPMVVDAVQKALQVEFVKLLEWHPESGDFLYLDGTGWKPEIRPGETRVPGDRASQAGYTLTVKEAVIVENLEEDRRFRGPALLRDHGVISGLSVIIAGESADRPYGVLGAHSRTQARYSEDDVNFVQSVSNILSEAIQRHRMVQALKKSEFEFRMLADNIAQLAWTCDEFGNITWYNKRWYDYTGTDWESMQGFGWMQVHHPDHIERVMKKVRRISTHGGSWEDTFPLRRHDGQFRWFLSRAVPIENDLGEEICWFGTNTDITELIEMENALRETDKRKDEFLATLAHELRNPLAPIRNGIKLLQHCTDEQRDDIMHMMERQSRQLIHLVDDLMDLSRISQSKINLALGHVKLQDVLATAVEAIRPQINRKAQTLQLEIPDAPIYLHADEVRITQVFSNLLTNASNYTPEQGSLSLRAFQENDSVTVSLQDSGVGLSEDQLEKIFEPFIQVDNSLTDTHSGLGLGLTLARSLVDMHHGSIDVTSEGPDRGATFSVTLPVSKAEDETTVQAETPSIDSANYRILVVDDNRDAATTLTQLLEFKGHQVIARFNGQDALNAFDEFRPEIILLDLGMAGMDGLEVARTIRNDKSGHSVTIIALTGWGQERDRQGTLAAGFDHHLVKPVDTSVIEEVIQKIRE